MAVIGELITVFAGNSAPLMASVAQSEAALRGYSASANTHAGIVTGAFHAIGNTAKVVGVVAAVGLALGAKAAGDFQEQMAIINTIAHQTPAELTKTGDSIRAMAVSSGTSLDDLTKAFYDLLSAGVPASHAISVLGQANTLAIGGLATTSQTVDLLTTAINAYHLTTGGAKVATDQFALAVQDGKVVASEIAATFADVAPLAKQAGVGIDEITTSYAVLTARGTPAAEAMTQMNRVMVELLKPSKDLSDLQEKTHLNFAKIAADKGLVVALQEMREAAAANNVPFQDLFGRLEGLKFALATTGPNFAAYASELDKMHHANGTAAAQAEERMGTFHRQTAILGESFNNLLITVGTPLLPFLTDLVGKINGGITAVTDWASKMPSLGAAISDVASRIGGALAGALAGIPNLISQIIPATGPIRTAFNAVYDAGFAVYGLISRLVAVFTGGSFSGIAGLISSQIPPTGALRDAFNTIYDAVVNAGNAISGAFSQGFEYLKNNQGLIPLIAGAIAGPLVLAFGAWAVSAGIAAASTLAAVAAAALAAAPFVALGVVIGVLAAAVITNFGGIRTTITSVIGTVAPIIQGVLGGAIRFVSDAIGVVVGWISNFVNHLTGSTNSSKQASTTLSTLGGVLSTVALAIGTVVGFLVTLVGGIIDAANKFGVFKAAGDLVYTLFGLLGTIIRNILGQVGDLAGIVGGALSTAFNAFGVVIAVIQGAFKNLADSIANVINLAKQAVDAVASVPGVKLGADVAGNVGGVLGNIGNELPKIPGIASGGYIAQTGLAVVHRGETVTPAGHGGGGPITIHTHLHVGLKEIAELVETHLFDSAAAFSSGFIGNPTTE